MKTKSAFVTDLIAVAGVLIYLDVIDVKTTSKAQFKLRKSIRRHKQANECI